MNVCRRRFAGRWRMKEGFVSKIEVTRRCVLFEIMIVVCIDVLLTGMCWGVEWIEGT